MAAAAGPLPYLRTLPYLWPKRLRLRALRVPSGDLDYHGHEPDGAYLVSLGGGADREWLEPLNDKGSRVGDGSPRFDDLVGCHVGNCEGLNVENPEPGMVYVWELNRGPELRTAAMNGAIIVTDDMPERASLRSLASTNQGTLDTAQIYQDVILVKYPAERIRQRREAEQKRAQAMLRSGSDEFLGRVTAAERLLDPRGRGTRFANVDHRIEVTDDRRDRVIDEWSPEHGILNR